MAQQFSNNIRPLLLFIQFLCFHTLQSIQIDANIGSNTRTCNDILSCTLKCNQNKCDNGKYYCIDTPVCNVQCRKGCNNLTLNVISRTIETVTTIQCQCEDILIHTAAANNYSQIINCNNICPPTTTLTKQPQQTVETTDTNNDIRISAEWTANFLSILLTFEVGNDIIIDHDNLEDDCAQIFDATNLQLIGMDSICIWNQEADDRLELVVDLASTARITLDSTLTIWDYVVESIDIPSYRPEPNILLSKASEIGACDALVLDARSSTNLGGREGEFIWTVTNMDDAAEIATVYRDKHVIVNSELLTNGVTYNIEVTVINWYGALASSEYTVYKSNNVQPVVSLHGISEYSPNNLNLNGNVLISGDIRLQSECTETETDEIHLDYDIAWTVQMQKINVDDFGVVIDRLKFNLLQERLAAFSNTESLVISAGLYLQSGFIYDFAMHLQCDPEGEYVCDINAVHNVVYPYTNIECGIFGGDILLNNVNPNILSDIHLILNGDVLTYDPELMDGDHSSLQWTWDCVQDGNGELCMDLLSEADAVSIQNIDLSAVNNTDYASTYSYVITMTVSDDSNVHRNACVDTVSLTVNTAVSDITTDANTLIIAATAISSTVNVNDELRIFGYVTFATDTNNEDVIYEYKWKEVNGLLSQHELEPYQQKNLILDPNVLMQGKIYSFQLAVTRTTLNGVTVGYGESNIVLISVNNAPMIVTDSFMLDPICSNQFESVSQLLAETHAVSITADGDYTPLLYEFGYRMADDDGDEIKYYLHDGLLSEAVFSDFYLPIGDFILFAHAYDSQSAVVSDAMECSRTLTSYSECDDFTDLLFLDNAQSESAKKRHILQQSMIYLQYLDKYDGGNEECVEQQLVHILDIVYQYFVGENDDICNQYKIIELTQTMTSLLSLMNQQNMAMYADERVYGEITELLFIVLDPCLYIMDEIENLKDLVISQNSVITQIAIIKYNDNDISTYLSPIISDIACQTLLFRMISSIIPMIKYLNDIEIYELLSSSIYIAQMVDISVSISGENNLRQFDLFSIYSARISGKSINIDVQNINVYIPTDVTMVANDNNSPFEGTDVLITARDTLANNVVVNADNDEFEGRVSGKSISITVLSETVDISDLPSNIEFTFECEEEDEDVCQSMQCVWHNEEDGIWYKDGCDTIINRDGNEIQCSCKHLTTFAIIYNMQETETNTNVFIDNESSQIDISMHWILAAMFLMITCYVMYQIYPFFVKKSQLNWKHRAVFVMMLVGITAFLYFLICMEYLFFAAMSIQVMSLLLLLPHITYLLIFSALFFTLFTLAHSFNTNIEYIRDKLRHYLIGLNVIVILMLFIYYILIVCNANEIVFKIASFAWSGLTTVITVIITIYAIISAKVLYETTQKSVAKQSFADQDWKVVRRLIVINSFITIYFIFETCITIYYSVYISNTKNIMQHKLIELVLNVCCLICIIFMYRNSIKRLVDDNKYRMKQKQIDSKRRKTKTILTNTTNTSNQTHDTHTHTMDANESRNESSNKTPESSVIKSANSRTSEMNLSVIKEESNIVCGMEMIKIDIPRHLSAENNNSATIATDIIMPEISEKSQGESNLINIKPSDTFQFSSALLRQKLNIMTKNKKNNKNDAGTNIYDNNPNEIESAMYDIYSSK